MSLILNWDKAQFDNKVSELEKYATRLKEKESSLEALKNQVATVMNDEQGNECSSLLNVCLLNVQSMKERTSHMIDVYKESSNNFASVSNVFTDAAKDIASIMSGTI